MEQIVERIRRLGTPLRNISDELLLALLSQSESVPNTVTGTILFEHGKSITHWYLILSGEVELYIPTSFVADVSPFKTDFSKLNCAINNGELSLAKNLNNGKIGRKVIRLKTLDAGVMFGDLNPICHSCSARVRQSLEFVRIPQNHFLALYSKHGDHLQPFIFVVEDLVAENSSILTSLSILSKKYQLQNHNKSDDEKNYNFLKLQNHLLNNQISYFNKPNFNCNIYLGNSNDQKRQYRKSLVKENTKRDNMQSFENSDEYATNTSYYKKKNSSNFLTATPTANLFEINNNVLIESRIYEAALALKRTMQLRSPWLISNHRLPRPANSIEIYANSMKYSEMMKWLSELCQEIFTFVNASASQSQIINENALASLTALAAEKRSELTNQRFSNLQLIGMWQALLDSCYIKHVVYELQFKSETLYQWAIQDPHESIYQLRADFYLNSVLPMLHKSPLFADVELGAAASAIFNGLLLPPLSCTSINFDAIAVNIGAVGGICDSSGDSGGDAESVDIRSNLPSMFSDLQNAIFLLCHLGPDCMLRVILCKPPHERSTEELELVYEELLHVKALSHLSTMVKCKLARVIRYEQHQHSGTVLFHQGDPGDSWYIIWRSGSVDVVIFGKGVVCTLREGDDFGKLALVNDAPRAATVVLHDDNSQFLRIDKHDFNKILRDVEANTVRLKERGQDVLVLERILQQSTQTPKHNPNLQSTSANELNVMGYLVENRPQCSYSMMAGIPEKMVEYLLETRIDTVTIYAIPITENNSVVNTTNANCFPSTIAAPEALTRSFDIDYSDLPLRFVDDLDVSFSGYNSDSNMNYGSSKLPHSSTVQMPLTVSNLMTQHNKSTSKLQLTSCLQLMFVVDNLDVSLEDFILTHIIFMPSNVLCNYLKNYYNRRRQRSLTTFLPLPPQLQSTTAGLNFQSTESDLDELKEQFNAKRRVVAFLVIWQHILGVHFFLDSVANSFVEEIYCCVLEDAGKIMNMSSVVEQISQLRKLREYAMTILSRHPKLVLDSGVYSAQSPAPNPVLPIDICNQCIYLSDTTFIIINVCLNKSASQIANIASIEIRRQRCTSDGRRQEYLTAAAMQQNAFCHFGESIVYNNGDDVNDELTNQNNGDRLNILNGNDEVDECFLVEVKSNGERVVYSPSEVSVPTMLSLNGKLYVIFAKEIDSLLPLPEQDGPTENIHHSVLELLPSRELAQQLVIFHTQLFCATNEIELIFQVIGRNQFPGRNSSNLDLLLRRFNEVQYWTSTEILLAPTTAKRFNTLKKFIKIAAHTQQMGDLMSVFAITLGLSNIAVSRLSHLWTKLPAKLKRQYAGFEALLDPSRNHRAYRLLISKLDAPIVPFVPLLLKDLTFIHEGNKTSFSGLINFEKMHMIANVLRSFRDCKSNKYQFGMLPPKKKSLQGLIRNFRIIDNQRRLMELSYAIESSNSTSAINIHMPHIDGQLS